MPKTIILPLGVGMVETLRRRSVEWCRGRIAGVKLTNDAGRIADRDRKRWHILKHYGSRANDRTLADCHAGQHAGVEANPHVTLDPDGSGGRNALNATRLA